MATALKQLTIALGLLASDPSALGPKLGLSGYVWNVRQLDQCNGVGGVPCLLLSSKWDWKRPQGYRVSMIQPAAPGAVKLRVYLDNQDRSDRDIVCLLLIAVSNDGKPAGFRFVSYDLKSQHSLQDEFTLSLAEEGEAIRLEIGSKQCDDTHVRDEKAARRVLAGR